MSFGPSDIHEPNCEHPGGERQPASACNICKDGPELAAWRAYWAAKPYEFVMEEPRPGANFGRSYLIEREDSGLEWTDGQGAQLVDGYWIRRRWDLAAPVPAPTGEGE